MKNIIYLFVALFLFASCEHELENTPNTNKGTAVASFKLGEKAIIEKVTFKDLVINFNLDIITRDNFTSAPVYVSYNDGEAKEFDQLSSTSSIISFDQGSIENVLGKLNIVDGDKFTFTVPYFVLNTTDTIRSTTVYTTIEKDENGVEKEVEITVDNTSSKVDGLPIFDQDLTYYVACPGSDLAGKYTVVSSMTSTDSGAKNNPTVDFDGEDVVIEQTSAIAYEISSGLGGVYKRLYGHWGAGSVTVKLLDICGEFVDNGTKGSFGAWFKVTSSSIDSTTGVITVEWENKWGDTGKNVYTPKN